NRIQILYDLGCGLAYLHSQCIVHGDIKPVGDLVQNCGFPLIWEYREMRLWTEMEEPLGAISGYRIFSREQLDAQVKHHRPGFEVARHGFSVRNR
ncbi:hypothetical protein FRC02_006544, partial [Tulasnella sp. 418]